ncbi:MAG TPA: phenylalanine--tRNA ligase beta subunit-related protein [Anaerolineae bacterium]|nr:phenylalanine--tRNA ligase beta subunit-related protein [Anaerolineae bacterium]HQM13418.1 phenylalanine--tRNA ligase beta subunit-related protein [Anaerolineae bacterium]
MSHLHYTIEPAVFDRFPDYVRGVVFACDVQNGDSPPALVAHLRAAEAEARARLTLDTLTAHPRIAAWREAFRTLGYKPGDFRPSIEALLRRVLRGQDLPTISALVDIGTVISLRHLLPIGGHAIDVLTQDIALRPATGEEVFIPFGSEELEHPLPGEFIFVEGDVVLTRRWSWRQAQHTLVTPETRALEFNVDGLPPVTRGEVEAICREVSELVTCFCNGDTRVALLIRDQPQVSFATSSP